MPNVYRLALPDGMSQNIVYTVGVHFSYTYSVHPATCIYFHMCRKPTNSLCLLDTDTFIVSSSDAPIIGSAIGIGPITA